MRYPLGDDLFFFSGMADRLRSSSGREDTTGRSTSQSAEMHRWGRPALPDRGVMTRFRPVPPVGVISTFALTKGAFTATINGFENRRNQGVSHGHHPYPPFFPGAPLRFQVHQAPVPRAPARPCSKVMYAAECHQRNRKTLG